MDRESNLVIAHAIAEVDRDAGEQLVRDHIDVAPEEPFESVLGLQEIE